MTNRKTDSQIYFSIDVYIVKKMHYRNVKCAYGVG